MNGVYVQAVVANGFVSVVVGITQGIAKRLCLFDMDDTDDMFLYLYQEGDALQQSLQVRGGTKIYSWV